MNGLPPLITEVSRPYWNGLRAEKLLVQFCVACEHWIFYPRIICPYCGSRNIEWRQVSGAATLYSFSVAKVPVSAAFTHAVGTIIGIAELNEGVRIPTHIIGVDESQVKIGMPLTPVFHDQIYPDVTMLYFTARPAV
jgi:uncharacterized OB-fold protein